MGGLVAGAYASGMTPAEIKKLMKDADWDLMFLSDSPYRFKTFRRKQDKREFPSQIEFGLKHGIGLPGALNPGQQVALMLDQIALPYGDLQSFDDLPTPFRAVATDLRKGDVVVLNRPPLSRAMRATMSIPGVFAPVNWDEWLLVDGGVLNNVPADVAKQLGADIIIAVNVGADVGDEEQQTQSLLSLLGKTIDTMMITSTRRSLEAATLVIDPDLKGLSSTSWRQVDELAKRGYDASAAVEPKLQAYALSPDAHAAFQAARQGRRKTETAVPTQMTFTAIGVPVSPRTEAEIRRILEPELNKPIEPAKFADRILRVTGDDRFEYLTYDVVSAPQPGTLQIGVRQKEYGPPFLMVGLDLSNIDSSNFAMNLSGRILHYGLVGVGSETRVDMVLGTNQHIGAEVLKPLGSTPIFVAGRAYFDRRARNQYLDDVFVAEYRIKRTGAGFDFGTDFGRDAELRLGYDAADFRGRRRIGSPELPEVDGSEQFAHLDFVLDTQTSPLVPTRGLRLRSYLAPVFLRADADKPAARGSHREPAGVHQRGSAGVVVQARSRPHRSPFPHRRRRDIVRRTAAGRRLRSRRSTAAGIVQHRSAARIQLPPRRRRLPPRCGTHAGRARRQHFSRRLGRDRIGVRRMGHEGLEERRHWRVHSGDAARAGVHGRQRWLPGRWPLLCRAGTALPVGSRSIAS